MAVQAQYPSYVLFPTRNEKERKNMEYSLQAQAAGFLDQSPLFFSSPSNGGSTNTRKRARESSATMHLQQQQPHPHSIDLFPLLQPPPQQPSIPPPPPPVAINTTLIDLSLLHTQPQPPTFVSTGLHLSFEADNHHHNTNQQQQEQPQEQQQQQQQQRNFALSPSPSPLLSSLLSEELSSQIKLQKDELDHYLQAQGEQLRRTVAEARRRQLAAVLTVAEEAVARRLREKEAELTRAARRNTELEERVARIRAETMTWQAKARAGESAISALHSQLLHQQQQQQNRVDVAICSGGGEKESAAAEDAESAYIDPERTEEAAAAAAAAAMCRVCRRRTVGAVLLPCRHLCVCGECGAAVETCPVCACVRSASLEVFFS